MYGMWTDFLAVITIQWALFAGVALVRRTPVRRAAGILLGSIALGAVFGIAFDLVVGKTLGVYTYRAGFALPFLVINGALSYGALCATVWLVRRERFWRFYLITTAVGAAYELANRLFPVWSWTFAGSPLAQEAIVILAAYCALALLLRGMLTLFLPIRESW